MDEEERAACLARQRELLERAAAADADVYVLDEAIDAAQAGAFSIEALLKQTEGAARARRSGTHGPRSAGGFALRGGLHNAHAKAPPPL